MGVGADLGEDLGDRGELVGDLGDACCWLTEVEELTGVTEAWDACDDDGDSATCGDWKGAAADAELWLGVGEEQLVVLTFDPVDCRMTTSGPPP